jgi:hypothetical protein
MKWEKDTIIVDLVSAVIWAKEESIAS